MRTPGFSGSLAFNEGVTSGPFFGNFAPVGANTQSGGNIAGQVSDIVQGGADSVLILTGAQSGGVNYVLPAVTAMIAAQAGFAAQDIIGSTWKLRIINNGTTQTITVTAGTGWTVGSGTNTIANNSFRDYVINILTATTALALEIGSGTYP